MLAERAGITLEQAAAGPEPSGPSKLDLFAVNAWAEGDFAAALGQSVEARGYVDRRGLSAEMVARFRLGYAPITRDWLATRARRAGFTVEMLELAGLVARSPENAQITPRAVPRPAPLPDPRREGPHGRLRRANPARARTKDGRRGPRRR